jgi:hypothetical protein
MAFIARFQVNIHGVYRSLSGQYSWHLSLAFRSLFMAFIARFRFDVHDIYRIQVNVVMAIIAPLQVTNTVGSNASSIIRRHDVNNTRAALGNAS